MSDWAEVGSPPDETSMLLMARMSKEEVGTSTDERQDAGFDAPLFAVSGVVLVPEPAPAETRRLPEYTNGLNSW